jgi:hypothetical protein
MFLASQLIVNLANEPYDEDGVEGGGEEEEEYDGWIGNRRRKLWKTTCTQGALNVRLSLLPIFHPPIHN